jgi:recombination protein RecA
MSTRPNNRPLPAGPPRSAWGEVVSTGSLALDLKLGTGGWPRGRIVEVFGPEGSGKTTLLLEAIAHAQQNSGFGAFLDADHATDQATAERLGVNVEAMPFHRTGSLEEAFEKIEEFVRGGAVDVIALDTLAALLPEGSRTDPRASIPPQKDAEHQHRIDYFLKALLGPLSRSGAVLLGSNQLVEKAGVMFGSPETTPWETLPLRTYASQRVELRRIMTLKEGDVAVGFQVRAKVVKNRLAPPLVQAEFELHFDTGICDEAALLDLGVEAGLLTRRSARHSFGDLLLGTGRADAVRLLRQDVGLAGRLRDGIIDRFRP